MQESTGTKRSLLSPVQRINRNLFLHIHAPRISSHSLRFATSMGLGLALTSLFLIMVVTGLLLILNYTPSIENAYSSVKDIIFVLPGGRYIRNIHRWSAHAMVFLGFLHMTRVFYTRSYVSGRKKNWIIGVSMLIVIMLSSFSGYLLPWDQLAYWAITIGSNIAASFREVTDLMGITSIFDPGGFIKRLLIGGEDVGQIALRRFFAFHVIIFPIVIIFLMSWHFWRIRKDGGLLKPGTAEEPGNKDDRVASWPVLMWAELAVFMTVLAIIMMVSFFADAPLLTEANPYLPENPAKSPWYFLGVQELLSYTAFSGGILIPALLFFFLFSIPYFDNDPGSGSKWFGGKKEKSITISSAILGIVLMCVLYIPEFTGLENVWNMPVGINMLVNPGIVFALLSVIWSIIAGRKYKSMRMRVLALFTMLMVGIVIFTIIGIWFRGEDWQFVWSGF